MRAFLLVLKATGTQPAIAIIQNVVSDLDMSGTEKNILTKIVANNRLLVKIEFNSCLLL